MVVIIPNLDALPPIIKQLVARAKERQAAQLRLWAEIEAEHLAACHPDGDPCPDGCDGGVVMG